MTSREQTKRLNTKLETVYKDILRIEETQLKASPFRDLTIKEMHTIDAIGLHAQPTSSEVADRLHVTRGTLTVSVNRLVQKGYVLRHQVTGDKRVVALTLSRKGRLMYRAHQAFHQKMVAHFIAGFAPAEVDLIETALDNLLGFLAQQE